MSHLIVNETPKGSFEYLVIAFAGWADASEAATTPIKYLNRKLKSTKFAELDPEEFYDFTQTRPHTTRTKGGKRLVHWPANDFYYWVPKNAGKGVVFCLGVEPNLKWRTFTAAITGLARDLQIKTVVHLGALLDAVPHTREVRLTGASTRADIQSALDDSGIRSSKYQGPTGISAVLMEECAAAGMEYVSLWGHTSHYLQAAPNYRVAYTLLKNLMWFLDLPVEISDLKSAAETFDREVDKAIAEDEQVSSYVKKLEGQYDEAVGAAEIPDPSDVVRDVEQFLRSEQRQRRRRGSGEGD
jgi:proteasome assembly chaperone (PAC2) family protein